ncbi:hypothetical protein KEM56_001241 [Ascosphaera pollenicola]|nr:hypothetical protein KEM56_001241 [Ascosphaera pollenicola]
MLRGTPEERGQFCRKAICVGVSVLTMSFLADYAYFREIAFPPLKFLQFNLVQSLAVFYGVNDWHYYVTQGFPLLLTTTLPFAFTGLARELFTPFPPAYKSIKRQLAIISVALPSALSLISHKEVRFVYSILPCLHILAAPSFVDYFGQIFESTSPVFFRRLWTLGGFLLANFLIGCYTSHTHASGVFDIISFLRTQFLDHYNGKGYPGATSSAHSLVYNATIMTVGFLMPCHSTPWRSHLVFPDIHAWALSCEPPVNFSPSEKREYLDEADQFYDNAWRFLGTHMTGGFDHLPKKPSYKAPRPALYDDIEPICGPKQETMHDWPDYLVFYQQFEPEVARYLSDSSYGECHRSFNTAWHDDWRRRGDMIIWCLDPEIQKFWKELKLVRGTQTNPVQDATAKALLRAKDFASPYVGNASVWTSNTGKEYASKGVSKAADLLWKWTRNPWPFSRLSSWLSSQGSPSDSPQMAPLPALREQANEDNVLDEQRKS